MHTDATLQVTIALEGPLAPLKLAWHKKIYIFQGEAAEIRRDQVEAAQEAAQKADIVFSVKSPLSASYLVMVSPGALAGEPPSLDPMQSFSQEAVDAGRILYLHSCPEAWSDAFLLVVASAWVLPLRTYRRAGGAAHCHPHRECKTSASPRVAATPWSLHCSASPGPTSPLSRALACRFWSHPGMGPCRRKMGLMTRPSAPSAGERTYDPRFPPMEAEALKVSLLLHPKAGHEGCCWVLTASPGPAPRWKSS